ncbi:MAG: SurA N-terminal domain-containing protein [Pseudomonadota bacterium]
MRFLIFLFIIVHNLAFASHILVVVDQKAITSMDVDKRIEALKIANPELELDSFMRKRILENLISESLFQNEAKRLKVVVSEEEVRDQFISMQKDHNIPTQLLNKLMQNKSFYQQVESQVLWNKLIGLVLYNKIKVSDAEIREEQKVRKGHIREVTFKQIIFNMVDVVELGRLQVEAQDCNSLDTLAKQYGFKNIYKNTIMLEELNPELQTIIRSIPENRLSDIISLNGQKQVIMVCYKNIINDPNDLLLIKQIISNRKINAEAQKYLIELRKRVYIEYSK